MKKTFKKPSRDALLKEFLFEECANIPSIVGRLDAEGYYLFMKRMEAFLEIEITRDDIYLEDFFTEEQLHNMRDEDLVSEVSEKLESATNCQQELWRDLDIEMANISSRLSFERLKVSDEYGLNLRKVARRRDGSIIRFFDMVYFLEQSEPMRFEENKKHLEQDNRSRFLESDWGFQEPYVRYYYFETDEIGDEKEIDFANPEKQCWKCRRKNALYKDLEVPREFLANDGSNPCYECLVTMREI